ncbi:MAG: SUMF1/EgtB/PvdO family nonheme iron enzyme [Cyclobacteriaceae bacterium]
MKRFITMLCMGVLSHAYATNLEVSQPLFYQEADQSYVVFNLSWENAWHNDKNHDAVWLFFRLQWPPGSKHQKVAKQGHEVVANFGAYDQMSFEVPDDQVGLFVKPTSSYRGDINLTIKVKLDQDDLADLNTRNAAMKVYGIEMVNIPSGGFTLGDPDPNATRFGAFFKPKKGEPNGLVEIKSEDQSLEVGEDGDLYYKAPSNYEGDQMGTIPAVYPKGVNSFYTMKYELTEGLYVDFLNSLKEGTTADREVFQADNYNKTGSIQNKEGVYSTAFQNRPARYVSWDDGMAFADWAGLRPMTEFEFTKAARGDQTPIENEFPWQTGERIQIQRLPDADWMLEMRNGWDESDLTDENRYYFGASYYWVMDLSGSIWERVISVGHPKGRAFQGTHGDGYLSDDGMANVENWPIGQDDTGGIGYRGGGFYGYNRNYTEYNPFSPIAYRPYGGWHGGMRSIAYGTRFVRSVD